MEVFLPSDIARLVYGYLLDESCPVAAKEFLESSPNMKECMIVVKRGQSFHTKVSGRTLTELMDVFSEIVHLVNLFVKQADNIDQSAVNFVEKVCTLLGLGSEFSSLKDKLNNPTESFVGENVVTIPGPLEIDDGDNYGPPSHVSTPKDKSFHDDSSIDLAIFDTLLNKTAFHEKLADNINKAITSSEVQYEEKEKSPLKESSIVKAALTTTEADPLFEEVINEIIAAAPNVEDTATEGSETGAGNNIENETPESEGSKEGVVERRPSLVELAMEGCVDSNEEVTPVTVLQSPLPQALLIQVLPTDTCIARPPSQECRPYRSILPKPTLGPIIEPISSKISVSPKIGGGVRTRGGMRRMKNQRVCSLVPNINTQEDGNIVASFIEVPSSSKVLRRSLRNQRNVPLSIVPEEVESEPQLNDDNQESESSVDQHQPQLNSVESQNANEIPTEFRNCKSRKSEVVNEAVDTTKSISAESNKIDDSSDKAEKETPVVRTKSVVKKSLSSPRKGSHVRVLDFKTPIKGVPARRANTSPKAVSQGKLSQLRSLRRVTLFKSPPKKDVSSWDKELRSFVEADIPLLSKKVTKFTKKKGGRPRVRVRPSPAKGRRRRITRKTWSIDKPSQSDSNISTPLTNDDIIEEIRNDVFNTILLDSAPVEGHTSGDKLPSLKSGKSPNIHNTDNSTNKTSPSHTQSALTEITHHLESDQISVDTVTNVKNVTNVNKTNVEITRVVTMEHVEFPAPSQLLMREKALKTPAKLPDETDYELTPVSKILKEQTSLLDRTVLLTPGLPPTPQIVQTNQHRRPQTPEEFRSQPTPPPPALESPDSSLQNTLINECMRIEEGIRVEKEHRRTFIQSPDPETSPSKSEIPSLVISSSPEHIISSTTASKSSSASPAESSSKELTCRLNSRVSLNTANVKPSKVGLSSKGHKNKVLPVMESPAAASPKKTPEKVISPEGAPKKSNKHKIKLKLPKPMPSPSQPIHPSTQSKNSHSPGKLSMSREKRDSQISKFLRDKATKLFEGENIAELCDTLHKSEGTQSKKRKSTPKQSKVSEKSPVLNITHQKSEKTQSNKSKSPPDKSKIESAVTALKPKKASVNSFKKELSLSTVGATRKKKVDDLNALPTFKYINEKCKTSSLPATSDAVTSVSKDEDIDSNDTFPRLQVSEDSCSLSPFTNNENISISNNVENSPENAPPSYSNRNGTSSSVSTKECSVVLTSVSTSRLGNNKSGRELIKDFSWINNRHTNISEDCHLSYFDEDTQTERNLTLSPMITCFEYPFPSFKERDKGISTEKRISDFKNPCDPDPNRTHSPERNHKQTFTTLKSDDKIDFKLNDPRGKKITRSPVSSPHRTEKYQHKNLPRILERRDYIQHPLQRHRARMRGESASRDLHSQRLRSRWLPERRRRTRDIRDMERNRRREADRLRRGKDQHSDRYLRAPVSPDHAHRSPNDSRKKDYSSMHCRENLGSNGYRNSRFNGDIHSIRSIKKHDETMIHPDDHHNFKSRTLTDAGNLDSFSSSSSGRHDKELRSRLSPPRDPRRVASLRDSSKSLSASKDTRPLKDPGLRIRPSYHSTPKDSHPQHKPLPSAKRRRSIDREEGEISDCDSMSYGRCSTSKKRNIGSPCEEAEVLGRGKSLLKNVDVDRFLSIVHGSP